MAVDLSVFDRLKSKSDFDREAEKYALEKLAKQAEIKKASMLDVDKLGEVAFMKAAMGQPLTPQEEGAAKFLDAKSGGLVWDPVTGSPMQKPRISDSIALGGAQSTVDNAAIGGAPVRLDVSQANNMGSFGIPAISETDLMGAIGNAPAPMPAPNKAPVEQDEMTALDQAEQAALASAGSDRRAQQNVKETFSKARADTIREKLKPMAPSLLAKQDEKLMQMGGVAQLNANLESVASGLESGAVQFGPVKNVINEGRNFLGKSNPESRNYADVNKQLMELVNTSLQLHKGVQTEGDAQRMANMINANPNDTKIIADAVRGLSNLNKTLLGQQQASLDELRAGAGKGFIDTSPFVQAPATIQLEKPDLYKKGEVEFNLRKRGYTPDQIKEYKRLRGIN